MVAQLQMEKGELLQRSRILESSLAANTHHEERLHCDEVRLPPVLIHLSNYHYGVWMLLRVLRRVDFFVADGCSMSFL